MMEKNTKCGWFITGTDTGVGKTYVTAALLAELRQQGVKAAAFKPIACGAGGRNDARTFARLMEGEVSLDEINPIYLRHPLAPSVAAKLEKRKIDLNRLFRAYQKLQAAYDIVLVEGAGGLMVPIHDDYFVGDLARDLGNGSAGASPSLPLIVVSRLSLGTINHTLLTVRQAQTMGLQVAGIVLNDTLGRRRQAERTNVEIVPKLCGVPLLGVMPHGTKDTGAAHVIMHKIANQIAQS